VHIEGLSKALPRGEALLVPFLCDVWVGEPIRWRGDRGALMAELEHWLCDPKGKQTN
jgi:1-acyl-sn-glycerol-3-phosphate acyltransferase